MLTTPHVAVVILNYNGLEYLKKYLPGVLQSRYDNKSIHIVDNASVDLSLSWLSITYPGIAVISLNKNKGYAGAYNEALAKIDADYYILLNTDVEVTENFIQPVIELMESDKKIGACQPKILSAIEKTKFEYAGAAGGWSDLIGFQFARGRVFDKLEYDEGQYNNNEPIFWACGACFFVRSTLFQQLGGFYEYYFMQSEETDLCWRMQNEGYKVYCCGSSSIYHIGGVHLANSDPFKTYLNMRNNMIMLTRNLPVTTLFLLVPIRLIVNLALSLGFLLKGQYAQTKGILKAQIHYLYWLLFVKTKDFPAKKGRKNIAGFYKGLVLWDYLVKRKTIFTDIIVTRN